VVELAPLLTGGLEFDPNTRVGKTKTGGLNIKANVLQKA
jgi:hypothetical protein